MKKLYQKLKEFLFDLSLPFSECKLCRHKHDCDHKVWMKTSNIDDCYYRDKRDGMIP